MICPVIGNKNGSIYTEVDFGDDKQISNLPRQLDKGVYIPFLILIETGKLNKKGRYALLPLPILKEDFVFFAFQGLLKPEEGAETLFMQKS